MNEINVVVADLSPNDARPGTFKLTLLESGGSRQLTMIIGMAEAQVIQAGIEQQVSPRPMTHDLITEVMSRFGVKLSKVVISNRQGDTYISALVCTSNQGEERFDARPSDAVALAVRVGVPMGVSVDLFTPEQVTKY